jgi:hypothetical protein
MTRYNIRRIFLLPAFKFGSLIGGLLLLFPGFLSGLLLWGTAGALRLWLESWDRVSLAGIAEVSFLNILKLTDVLEFLQWLDDLGWLLVVATTLGALFLGGLLVGILVTLGAAFYNILASWGGGLVVLADVKGGTMR